MRTVTAQDALPTADEGASRINLRMPDSLKARVEAAALREGRSVNAWLVRAATTAVNPGGSHPPQRSQPPDQHPPRLQARHRLGPVNERNSMRTFPTPAPIAVTVEVNFAEVQIVASDRSDTVVDVRPTDPDDHAHVQVADATRVDLLGDQLQVIAPKPSLMARILNSPSLDIVIRLPEWVSRARRPGRGQRRGDRHPRALHDPHRRRQHPPRGHRGARCPQRHRRHRRRQRHRRRHARDAGRANRDRLGHRRRRHQERQHRSTHRCGRGRPAGPRRPRPHRGRVGRRERRRAHRPRGRGHRGRGRRRGRPQDLARGPRGGHPRRPRRLAGPRHEVRPGGQRVRPDATRPANGPSVRIVGRTSYGDIRIRRIGEAPESDGTA